MSALRTPPAVKLEKWCVVYCKQYPEAVIPAPGRGVLEWKFRVRAQSSEGWSPWSPHKTDLRISWIQSEKRVPSS